MSDNPLTVKIGYGAMGKWGLAGKPEKKPREKTYPNGTLFATNSKRTAVAEPGTSQWEAGFKSYGLHVIIIFITTIFHSSGDYWMGVAILSLFTYKPQNCLRLLANVREHFC
jgi:hypothetical protein